MTTEELIAGLADVRRERRQKEFAVKIGPDESGAASAVPLHTIHVNDGSPMGHSLSLYADELDKVIEAMLDYRSELRRKRWKKAMEKKS